LRLKRRIKAICFLLLGVLLSGSLTPAFADSSREGLDIVFVIDDTRSMQQNDPGFLSAEALRQFVDILPQTGDQVGIVTYALNVLDKMSLREIRDAHDKEDIKDFASHNTIS